MRKVKNVVPVRGRRWRLTREDACGAPLYGDNGQVTSDGVVSGAVTIITNDLSAIQTTNSNGDTCLNIPAQSRIEAVSVELALCGMDPDFFEITTGIPVVYDIDGVAVGVVIDTAVDTESISFGLEIWTGLGGEDACGDVGEVEYGYILAPFLKGARLSDFTVENGAVNFSITGATSRKGGSWGKGPYPVVVNEVNSVRVAGPLLVGLTSTQPLLAITTKVAPPAASIGGRPLLNPAWAVLSAVHADAVDGSMHVDFSISPTLPAGQGVYYDFGDDEWEYVTTNSGAWTHTYAENGTYTVTATVNGQKVVETTVTVPFDAS